MVMEIMRILRRELIYLWYYFDVQLRQIFWYWVLGIAIGSLISVFAKDSIHQLFRKIVRLGNALFGDFDKSVRTDSAHVYSCSHCAESFV